MSAPFRPIIEACYRTLQAAQNAQGSRFPHDPVARADVEAKAKDELRQLNEAIALQLRLGDFGPLRGRGPPDGADCWEVDLREMLEGVRIDAGALLHAAIAIPPQPVHDPLRPPDESFQMSKASFDLAQHNFHRYAGRVTKVAERLTYSFAEIEASQQTTPKPKDDADQGLTASATTDSPVPAARSPGECEPTISDQSHADKRLRALEAFLSDCAEEALNNPFRALHALVSRGASEANWMQGWFTSKVIDDPLYSWRAEPRHVKVLPTETWQLLMAEFGAFAGLCRVTAARLGWPAEAVAKAVENCRVFLDDLHHGGRDDQTIARETPHEIAKRLRDQLGCVTGPIRDFADDYDAVRQLDAPPKEDENSEKPPAKAPNVLIVATPSHAPTPPTKDVNDSKPLTEVGSEMRSEMPPVAATETRMGGDVAAIPERGNIMADQPNADSLPFFPLAELDKLLTLLLGEANEDFNAVPADRPAIRRRRQEQHAACYQKIQRLKLLAIKQCADEGIKGDSVKDDLRKAESFAIDLLNYRAGSAEYHATDAETCPEDIRFGDLLLRYRPVVERLFELRAQCRDKSLDATPSPLDDMRHNIQRVFAQIREILARRKQLAREHALRREHEDPLEEVLAHIYYIAALPPELREREDRLDELFAGVENAVARRGPNIEAERLGVVAALVALWSQLREEGIEPFLDSYETANAREEDPGFQIAVKICRAAMRGESARMLEILKEADCKSAVSDRVFTLVKLNRIAEAIRALRTKEEQPATHPTADCTPKAEAAAVPLAATPPVASDPPAVVATEPPADGAQTPPSTDPPVVATPRQADGGVKTDTPARAAQPSGQQGSNMPDQPPLPAAAPGLVPTPDELRAVAQPAALLAHWLQKAGALTPEGRLSKVVMDAVATNEVLDAWMHLQEAALMRQWDTNQTVSQSRIVGWPKPMPGIIRHAVLAIIDAAKEICDAGNFKWGPVPTGGCSWSIRGSSGEALAPPHVADRLAQAAKELEEIVDKASNLAIRSEIPHVVGPQPPAEGVPESASAQYAAAVAAWRESHEIIPELNLTPEVLRPVLAKAERLLEFFAEYHEAIAVGSSRLALRTIHLWQRYFQAAVAVEQELDRLGFGPRKQVTHLRGPHAGILGLEMWLMGMRLGAHPNANSEEERRRYWGEATQSGNWRMESLEDPPDFSKRVLPELREHVKQLRSDCSRPVSNKTERTGKDRNDKPDDVDWKELLLSPPLSAAQIAERLRQPVDLVERTLRYFRKQHDFGFTKDEDAGFGEAAFRYKMEDVLLHLKKWYDKRQKKAARANT